MHDVISYINAGKSIRVKYFVNTNRGIIEKGRIGIVVKEVETKSTNSIIYEVRWKDVEWKSYLFVEEIEFI